MRDRRLYVCRKATEGTIEGFKRYNGSFSQMKTDDNYPASDAVSDFENWIFKEKVFCFNLSVMELTTPASRTHLSTMWNRPPETKKKKGQPKRNTSTIILSTGEMHILVRSHHLPQYWERRAYSKEIWSFGIQRRKCKAYLANTANGIVLCEWRLPRPQSSLTVNNTFTQMKFCLGWYSWTKLFGSF